MDLKSLKAKDVVEGAPDLAREIAALVGGAGGKPEAASYAQLKALFGDDLQGVDACITKGMTLAQATAHKADRATAALAAEAAKAKSDLDAANAKLAELTAANAKLTTERDELKKKSRGVATGTIAHEEPAANAGGGADEPGEYEAAVKFRAAALADKEPGLKPGTAMARARASVHKDRPDLYEAFKRAQNTFA